MKALALLQIIALLLFGFALLTLLLFEVVPKIWEGLKNVMLWLIWLIWFREKK